MMEALGDEERALLVNSVPAAPTIKSAAAENEQDNEDD